VPQIDAGIREPLALQCPGGNNAVLEAYDPTTGDATTATAGASGGYPGAGYNYRLLYLNSNARAGMPLKYLPVSIVYSLLYLIMWIHHHLWNQNWYRPEYQDVGVWEKCV